jgi:nicotinate phosphoribosyltransferase
VLPSGGPALFTDLYELTMAASYYARGLLGPATFDLVARELPPRRGYLVACGLEQALEFLEHWHLDDDAREYLRSLDRFDDDFLEFLGELRFTGEVWAIPEGEVVFPDEPLLRVTAPLVEAQLVETFLLNCVGHQTMVATKAARVATACGNHPFVDFAPRRDHGADAALYGARAAFVGGASGTSLVLAGQRFGLELSGTMAHSYVMRFDDEREALRSFALDHPGRAVLLIDTYDTVRAARLVVDLAPELRAADALPVAVRLDSGDLAELSRAVRDVLDRGGLDQVRIFASGDLDEYRIADLLGAGAPIDAFGVGTQLGTSGDAPHVGVVYKLAEDPGGPRMKLARGKPSLPGRKQVYRVVRDGEYAYDVLALDDEPGVTGEAVLVPFMRDGTRTGAAEPLADVQARGRGAVAALPARLRRLEPQGPPYEVRLSPGLGSLVTKLRAEYGGT